jgi:hypothetical protein
MASLESQDWATDILIMQWVRSVEDWVAEYSIVQFVDALDADAPFEDLEQIRTIRSNKVLKLSELDEFFVWTLGSCFQFSASEDSFDFERVRPALFDGVYEESEIKKWTCRESHECVLSIQGWYVGNKRWSDSNIQLEFSKEFDCQDCRFLAPISPNQINSCSGKYCVSGKIPLLVSLGFSDNLNMEVEILSQLSI